MKKWWLALWLLAGCSDQTLEPSSHVSGVRLLATRIDQPYAAPGDAVTLEALAVDARVDSAEAMQIYWFDEPCINPPGDAYYGCFARFRERFRPGAMITQGLELGPRFSFTMPELITESHRDSGQTPYGLAVVFTIACAGQVVYRPPGAGSSPDAVPFVCLKQTGQISSADEFVFAYSLVYAFEERRNQNPVLQGISFGGMPVDASTGLHLDHCTHSQVDDCPAVQLDVVVPSESQELDPSNLTPGGAPLLESLYVQYYSTAGKLDKDALTVFDARAGRLGHTGNDFRAPQNSGEYLLWAVLHDNRGGVAWQELALHVR